MPLICNKKIKKYDTRFALHPNFLIVDSIVWVRRQSAEIPSKADVDLVKYVHRSRRQQGVSGRSQIFAYLCGQ